MANHALHFREVVAMESALDSAFAREVSDPEEFPGQAASSTRLPVTGIDHVPINVPDIDAAASK